MSPKLIAIAAALFLAQTLAPPLRAEKNSSSISSKSFFHSRNFARKLRFLEEFYRMYYLPLKFENSDLLRNIHWLNFALNAPFAPPIQAILPQENEDKYARYQALMKMHIHYLITKNTILLAARFDKHRPVFFNRPYKKDILKSLDIAKTLYQSALKAWNLALTFYDAIQENPLPEWSPDRTNLDFLENTLFRIQEEELDYLRVLQRKLEQLQQKKEYFENP